jgi:hypothetical protein
MGATASCPNDFDKDLLTCRMSCPPGFKYQQVRSNPPRDRCVLFTDLSKGFDLQPIPKYEGNIVPAQFDIERQRVNSAAAAIKSLSPIYENSSKMTRDYESIKSQYAGFSAESDAGKRIKAVSDSIKTPRPPVQPNPIINERDKILKPLNFAVIQVVLLTILVSLVEFLVIPPQYASYVVFITLCVGAAAGIYLSSR